MSNLSDISWPQYTEQNWAANDPNGNSDIMNEGYDELWTIFTTEHDKDGDHWTSGVTYAKVEEGTWAGDGGGDKIVSLADGTLDIKWIKIMGTDLTDVYIATESFTANKTGTAEDAAVFIADYIKSIGTGTFTVGTVMNTNTEDYYYVAVGE